MNIKKFFFFLFIILIDVFLYIAIGMILLNYEDSYDKSEGAYFSLESMTLLEKFAYIGYYVWFIANIFLGLYLVYRFLKKYILK